MQECIKKAIIFNKEYLQELYRIYPELFESEEEVYRIVFGNYEKEEDYGKRPLSKLTKDIIQELWEYSGWISVKTADLTENRHHDKRMSK